MRDKAETVSKAQCTRQYMSIFKTVSNAEQAKKLSPIAKHWDDDWLYNTTTDELWGTIEDVRFPIKYMANMFGAGDEQKVVDRLKKLMAVRIHRRGVTVGDIDQEKVDQTLADVGMDAEMADDIYYLTSLAKFDDRFVIPPAHREQAMEMIENTGDVKGSIGFGFNERPERGL